MLDSTGFETDVRVGLLGDLHGNTPEALKALDALAEAGVRFVFQLGDFGLWPRGEAFLKAVEKRLTAHDQILLVTLGNHENYPRMEKALESELFTGWLHLMGYERTLFAPRVHGFEWAGRKCLSVGGANSIDVEGRREGFSWWPEEQITLGDVLRAHEHEAEVMFTHECPAGVPLFGEADAGEQAVRLFGRRGVEYAMLSREAMRAITDEVRPSLLFHGHYHFHADHTVELTQESTGESYQLRTVGLTRDTMEKLAAVFDFSTLEWSFVV